MPTERVENAKGRGPLTALSNTHTIGAIRSKGHLQKGAGGGVGSWRGLWIENMVSLKPREECFKA